MSDKNSKKLREMLAKIKSVDDPFKSSYHTDPRQLILDPETVNQIELDRHQLLCEDLDLLEELDIDNEDYY